MTAGDYETWNVPFFKATSVMLFLFHEMYMKIVLAVLLEMRLPILVCVVSLPERAGCDKACCSMRAR